MAKSLNPRRNAMRSKSIEGWCNGVTGCPIHRDKFTACVGAIRSVIIAAMSATVVLVSSQQLFPLVEIELKVTTQQGQFYLRKFRE